jgi:hypothetical protein
VRLGWTTRVVLVGIDPPHQQEVRGVTEKRKKLCGEFDRPPAFVQEAQLHPVKTLKNGRIPLLWCKAGATRLRLEPDGPRRFPTLGYQSLPPLRGLPVSGSQLLTHPPVDLWVPFDLPFVDTPQLAGAGLICFVGSVEWAQGAVRAGRILDGSFQRHVRATR